MNLVIIIIITALAIVGGLTLLDWLVGKPSLSSTTVNAKRRSLLTLIAAVAGGALVGGLAWSRHKRTRKTLSLLFELELLLAQLDGLVGVALAQHDLKSTLPFMEAVAAKIGDYADRAAGLMPQLQNELSISEFAAVSQGTSMLISALYSTSEKPVGDVRADTETNTLKTIQKGVEIAKKEVRELIDERI